MFVAVQDPGKKKFSLLGLARSNSKFLIAEASLVSPKCADSPAGSYWREKSQKKKYDFLTQGILARPYHAQTCPRQVVSREKNALA